MTKTDVLERLASWCRHMSDKSDESRLSIELHDIRALKSIIEAQAKEIERLTEALEAGGTRILVLLGGERDAMPDHVVRAFQNIAGDLTAALTNTR